MSSISFSHSLRRLWALERFGPSLRFFIALTCSMAWCWYNGQMELLTQLFLGVIASALAESDDSWQGRLFSLCVTLICFSSPRPQLNCYTLIRGCLSVHYAPLLSA